MGRVSWYMPSVPEKEAKVLGGQPALQRKSQVNQSYTVRFYLKHQDIEIKISKDCKYNSRLGKTLIKIRSE